MVSRRSACSTRSPRAMTRGKDARKRTIDAKTPRGNNARDRAMSERGAGRTSPCSSAAASLEALNLYGCARKRPRNGGNVARGRQWMRVGASANPRGFTRAPQRSHDGRLGERFAGWDLEIRARWRRRERGKTAVIVRVGSRASRAGSSFESDERERRASAHLGQEAVEAVEQVRVSA